MKVKLLRERALSELKASVTTNVARYRTGEFSHLAVDPSLSFESDIELDVSAMAGLKAPIGGDNFESENCTVMLSALKSLTPFQAADERLWTMLSHTVLLCHGRLRWPIPKDDQDATKHIRTHFFGSSERQLERDNIGARLWWMGHLCSRVKGMPLGQCLEVLLFKSDVRANIVERPTTAQSVPIFTALINKLAKSHQGKKKLFERQIFCNLMVQVNGLGGYRLLDALDSKMIEQLIDKVVSDDLKLSAL
jgi:hypothetical protein